MSIYTVIASPKKLKNKDAFFNWLINDSVKENSYINSEFLELRPHILATHNYISGCSCCSADDFFVLVSAAFTFTTFSLFICLDRLHHTTRCDCPDFDFSNIQPILVVYEKLGYSAEEILYQLYNGEYTSFMPINQVAKSELDQLAENYMIWLKYDNEYNQHIRNYIKIQDTVIESSDKNLDYYH